jgi:hypothetical protein
MPVTENSTVARFQGVVDMDLQRLEGGLFPSPRERTGRNPLSGTSVQEFVQVPTIPDTPIPDSNSQNGCPLDEHECED